MNENLKERGGGCMGRRGVWGVKEWGGGGVYRRGGY